LTNRSIILIIDYFVNRLIVAALENAYRPFYDLWFLTPSNYCLYTVFQKTAPFLFLQ